LKKSEKETTYINITPPSDKENISNEFRISVLWENLPTVGSFMESSRTCLGIYFLIVRPRNLDQLTQSLYGKFSGDYIKSLTIEEKGCLKSILRREM
jgi:hypothetical protein